MKDRPQSSHAIAGNSHNPTEGNLLVINLFLARRFVDNVETRTYECKGSVSCDSADLDQLKGRICNVPLLKKERTTETSNELKPVSACSYHNSGQLHGQQC